jgi:hypothetical protein
VQVALPQVDAPEGAYTPPDTLTDTLAISMLTDAIQAQTRGPLGKTQEDILRGTEFQIQEAATDILYTNRDLTISNTNSEEALRAYGNRVAEIALIHSIPTDTRDEIVILQDATEKNDPQILQELTPIIEAYTGMRDNMLTVQVPSSLTKEHLDLLNTYNAILIDIEGMAIAFDDPLYAMARSNRYYDDAIGFSGALTNLYTNLYDRGIRWGENDIVPKFVKIGY